jgi:centrin-3
MSVNNNNPGNTNNTLIHKNTNNNSNCIDESQEIKEIFDLLDNGKGFVEMKDLKIAFHALDFKYENEEVKNLINKLQLGEPSVLNFNEFYKLLSFKMLDRDVNKEYEKNFSLISDTKSNLITFESLKKVIDDLGENISNDELNEIINEIASDPKHGITEDDYILAMKENNLKEL